MSMDGAEEVMLEKVVKDALRKYLRELGAYQFWPVQMGYGSATIDCLFCYEGQFYGVETKRPGVDEPKPRQALVMSAIHAAGGKVCVENDPALPNVKKMLGL
jgi:hypothetical protein